MLLSFVTVGNAETLSKSSFASHFIKQLQADFPEKTFSLVGELQITAKDANGEQITTFLTNAYADYLSGRYDFETLYNTHSATFKTLKQQKNNIEIERIFPVIKSNDYLDTVKQQLKAAGLDESKIPYYDRLNEDLLVFYAFDTAESMRYLLKKDIEQLPNSNKIKPLSSDNLLRYYRDINAEITQLDDHRANIYFFKADEYYETSLLITPQFWQDKIDFQGKPVVFIPARGFAMIVDSADEVSLNAAEGIAKNAVQDWGYPISPFGYVLHKGKWEKFER